MDNKLFGDHTDYTHLTFDDLSIYLEDKALTLEYFLNFIETDKKEVIESGFWPKKVFFDFVSQADECITLYKSTIKELREVKKEIGNEVKQNHYNRLLRIAVDSNKINRRLGVLWNQEYVKKDYGNEDFRKVERIYCFTRDLSVTLTDLGNFAERLKDFIGRENPTKKSRWERSHKIALASFIVALTVLIFGNNLIEKFKNKSNINSSTTKPSSEKQFKEVTILNVKELPYLENYPIIDKGLFIKYYYNDLHLGGVNIVDLKLNARTKLSNPIKLIIERDVISLGITEEPFIEFEYKNKFYSIEISGRHYSFNVTLKQILKPTLKLKKFDEIKDLLPPT
jgi:hypothetical protein